MTTSPIPLHTARRGDILKAPNSPTYWAISSVRHLDADLNGDQRTRVDMLSLTSGRTQRRVLLQDRTYEIVHRPDAVTPGDSISITAAGARRSGLVFANQNTHSTARTRDEETGRVTSTYGLREGEIYIVSAASPAHLLVRTQHVLSESGHWTATGEEHIVTLKPFSRHEGFGVLPTYEDATVYTATAAAETEPVDGEPEDVRTVQVGDRIILREQATYSREVGGGCNMADELIGRTVTVAGLTPDHRDSDRQQVEFEGVPGYCLDLPGEHFDFVDEPAPNRRVQVGDTIIIQRGATRNREDGGCYLWTGYVDQRRRVTAVRDNVPHRTSGNTERRIYITDRGAAGHYILDRTGEHFIFADEGECVVGAALTDIEEMNQYLAAQAESLADLDLEPNEVVFLIPNAATAGWSAERVETTTMAGGNPPTNLMTCSQIRIFNARRNDHPTESVVVREDDGEVFVRVAMFDANDRQIGTTLAPRRALVRWATGRNVVSELELAAEQAVRVPEPTAAERELPKRRYRLGVTIDIDLWSYHDGNPCADGVAGFVQAALAARVRDPQKTADGWLPILANADYIDAVTEDDVRKYRDEVASGIVVRTTLRERLNED